MTVVQETKHLLGLPKEIRDIIWNHVFLNTIASPQPLPDSKFYKDYCEVCQTSPPAARPLSHIIQPLLTCRQFHSEARPYLYTNLTLLLTSTTNLRPITHPHPRPLPRNLRHLTIYNHLDLSDPHPQSASLSLLLSLTPKRSLTTLTLHNHMHPPSSYDLLCPGIHYISPLLSLPPTSALTLTTHFAYRWEYVMFTSPLLGEIKCSDALSEHEAVLRELQSDQRFRQAVKDGSEEEQTWALLRVARGHERSWLLALRDRRLRGLSEEEREAVEREMQVEMEPGVADDEEESD